MRDTHSFARPDEAVVRHLALDLTVDFTRHQLSGSATLQIEHRGARELALDSNGLSVGSVTLDDGTRAKFSLGESQPYLGRALTIAIAPQTKSVKIDYQTSPDAAAVQWLDPQQTAGQKLPFLLSQSESILARTWVPCQDTPGVRMTYEATLRVPPGMLGPDERVEPGARRPPTASTSSRCRSASPPYLLAIAVGDMSFRGVRCAAAASTPKRRSPRRRPGSWPTRKR